jgi:hypothetical protein
MHCKNILPATDTVVRTIFPGDCSVDRRWMLFLMFLFTVDVLSTTLLLWGGAGAGTASEANPIMIFVVHQPFLHLSIKLTFALFTLIIANIMEHNYRVLGTLIVRVACLPYMLAFTINLIWLMYSVKRVIVADGGVFRFL